MIQLDYTLETAEERNELVKKILEENPEPNQAYLDILAKYLVMPLDKAEKKQKQILTDNRMLTITGHETSFEGLVAQLENGEDGIYNMMNESKQTIFKPHKSITKKDLDEIPELKQLYDTIIQWKEIFKTTTNPKDRWIIKNMLKELSQDQYVIKNAVRQPIAGNKISHSRPSIYFEDTTNSFDEEGYPIPSGISLMNPKICSAILCNYSKLKENGWESLQEDTRWLIMDFENLCDKALQNYPLYKQLVIYKIDGKSNIDIQTALQIEFGIKHSIEYISSLWRNKIPKMIASAATDEYLDWYYLTQEKGKYKKCSRCGQIKLAHNKYFSKNKTSKDGFYSICKECRNKKNKKEK